MRRHCSDCFYDGNTGNYFSGGSEDYQTGVECCSGGSTYELLEV